MIEGGNTSAFRPTSMLAFQEPDGLESSEIKGLSGSTRWMIPYADLLTLLMGYFLVLLALAKMPEAINQPVQHDAGKTKTTISAVAPTKSENEPILANLALADEEPVKDALQPEVIAAEEFKKLAGNQGVQVRQDQRGITISLRDSLLFKPGSADLLPSSRSTLSRLADLLSDISHPIRVEGHTDNTPIATHQYPSNWELSTARATHIVKYLVTAHKMNPGRLSAAGYGEFKPVANNSSVEGKQKNRRVDIVIMSEHEATKEPGHIGFSHSELSNATPPMIRVNPTFGTRSKP